MHHIADKHPNETLKNSSSSTHEKLSSAGFLAGIDENLLFSDYIKGTPFPVIFEDAIYIIILLLLYAT